MARDRVIIVEDDRDLRDSLVEYFNLTGLLVVGVGSCLEFYRAIAEASFSIAVIDVGLPDQSGYVLVEYIRKNSSMGVIVLTARDSMEDRLRGYGIGADLYLVKPVDCRELGAAISNLAARLVAGRSDEPAVDGLWRLLRQSWCLVAPSGASIPLTYKEVRFLSCLAEQANQPVRRDAMLSALGYRDDECASRALDAMVRRLRRKIEKASTPSHPFKTVHAVGYCLTAPLFLQ